MKVDYHNTFNMDTYRSIIRAGKECGYKFVTISEFVELGCPKDGYFIIRHDLDLKPLSLKCIAEVEREEQVRSTTFVRLVGADYNLFSYPVFEVIQYAAVMMELGLHSNFVEFAAINDVHVEAVLKSELQMLRSFFPIYGIAPHRDINYTVNSLPWLDKHWDRIRHEYKLSYHAYESRILESTIYVNEGFNPHLCWRNLTPFDAMKTQQSVYMLTHPHWWFKHHPFET